MLAKFFRRRGGNPGLSQNSAKKQEKVLDSLKIHQAKNKQHHPYAYWTQ